MMGSRQGPPRTLAIAACPHRASTLQARERGGHTRQGRRLRDPVISEGTESSRLHPVIFCVPARLSCLSHVPPAALFSGKTGHLSAHLGCVRVRRPRKQKVKLGLETDTTHMIDFHSMEIGGEDAIGR